MSIFGGRPPIQNSGSHIYDVINMLGFKENQHKYMRALHFNQIQLLSKRVMTSNTINNSNYF